MIETISKPLLTATLPLRYFLDGVLYRHFADKTALAALRNKYSGMPVLVVGNGPSLNRTPLDDFENVPSIGMNKIDMIFPRTRWRPSIIVCANNLVAAQHQDQFASSYIPIFLAWKARWMLSRSNRSKVDYFNSNASNDFSTDALGGFGSSATVTYTALQMAYWMGANPVILLGVDHNFQYSGPEASYQKREGADLNHFDPNYFKAGGYWGTPDLQQSEEAYRLARTAYEKAGRLVYDATVGGNLQVFDNISIANVKELVTASRKPA